ncbi:transporter, major facilitator family [Verrucomicrobiia bacterium DG1235]|nr:transporter, major facilitator family [Verrucomicrobiae bacterium DG1235]
MRNRKHPQQSESKAWKTLFLVSFINSAQTSLAVVGIPSHVVQTEMSQAQLGLLLGAMPLFAGLSAFCSGFLSDFLGRKSLLIAGLALLGTSLSLHAFASSFPILLTLRSFTGLSTGIIMGLPSALLSDSYPTSRQQTLTGKTLCGYAIGQTIGIPIGILFMDWTDFLLLCSLLGFFTLLVIPLARAYVPSTQTQIPRKNKWASTYLKLARSTIRDPQFALVSCNSFLSFMALSIFYVTFALWLFDTAKLRPAEVAPMYLGAGILQIIVFAYLVQLTAKLNVRTTIATSLLVNSLLFATAYLAFQSLTSAAVLFALTLATVSARIPGLQFLMNNCGEAPQKGLRISIVQTCGHIGKAIGSVAASFLFTRIEAHQTLLICSGITLICCILFITPVFLETNSAQASTKTEQKQKLGLGEVPDNSRKKWLWHARC